ncbi:MAG: class I SAM-dependent methyltransferase [Hyphomicrobiaceae bacterium]|nr:class I SAM-dependent methyltransferase [Hyphomicrobiaceae bacterium]
MYVDVLDLREFYGLPLGRAVRVSLGQAIDAVWPDAPDERIAGLGYCVPWLERYRANAERVIALMPAAQGAVEWPAGGPSAAALVYDEQLPLPDSSIDRLMMVHLLEHSESPAATLKEAWRVLTPGGKLLIAVPNRRGMWARLEHTPFGTGRPFSRGQLATLLRDAMLSPITWSDALHFPPVRRAGAIRVYRGFEKIGKWLWPAFSGVIMVEASKQLYQGLPAESRSRQRVFVPVLAPQGSARAGRMISRRD